MNKRIKELMGQTLDEKFAGTWSVMDLQDLTKFADRFAELIVQECSNFLKDTLDDHFAAEQLEEHFGVEDKSIKVGGRIKVVSKFNIGARGTVTYIEPTGKLWVRRDGASSDVSYYPTEVIGVD